MVSFVITPILLFIIIITIVWTFEPHMRLNQSKLRERKTKKSEDNLKTDYFI